MPDHHYLFRTPSDVRGVELPLTAGTVPADLRGTLLRNGPGAQRAGETPVHFLDGYGFVAAARFDAGRVTYHARHVALPLADRERAAGQLLGRRPFTNRPGGRLANLLRLQLSTGTAHEVYAWGGSVVASDVDGHVQMDPVTLETRGPAPVNALIGGLTLACPMPRPDPWSGNLVAYAAGPGMIGGDTVTFVEFDAGWNERARVRRSLGAPGVLLHDLVATEGHYLAVQLGLLSVPALALGGCVPLDAVHLPPGAGRVVVVPRRGDGPVRSMPLPEGYQGFHVANAYEEGGRLIADVVVYEGLLDFSPLNPPEIGHQPKPHGAGPFLARLTLDLASGAHDAVVHREARGESPCVRPDRTGRKHRFVYVSAPGTRGDEPVGNAYYWWHAIGAIDADAGVTVATWDAGPRVYVTPPQFVARGPGDDEGWLLAWTHDTADGRGELVILDAADLARGPVARLALPEALPAASHGDWLADG